MHSVVSGPLDCDKLDYLKRDSTHLGVPFGAALDQERFLRNLTLIYENSGEDYRAEIGVTEKARAVAQSIWRARRDMFMQVYWQHTVRSLKAMLSFVARRIIENNRDNNVFWGKFREFRYGGYVSAWSAEEPFLAEEVPPAEKDVIAELTEAAEPTNRYGFVSGLSPSDDSLLAFLWRFADDVGRKMIKAIRERHVYSRIAVFSAKSKSQAEKDKYDQLHRSVQTDLDRGSVTATNEMRLKCEKNIIAKLREGVEKKEPTPSDETKRMLERIGKTDPFILVDVPVKTSASRSFRYLPERVGDAPRVQSRPLIMETRSEEDAVSLGGEDFDLGVGKIRVFVAPDFREFVTKFLESKDIIPCLTS